MDELELTGPGDLLDGHAARVVQPLRFPLRGLPGSDRRSQPWSWSFTAGGQPELSVVTGRQDGYPCAVSLSLRLFRPGHCERGSDPT